MARPRKYRRESPFLHQYEMEIDGWTISRGDTIKIHGEYGVKFRFNALVTNPETGVQWVDCFELEKGIVRSWRAFSPDKAKRIPKRRKRVNRD